MRGEIGMVNQFLISLIVGIVIGCLLYKTPIGLYLQKVLVIISKRK